MNPSMPLKLVLATLVLGQALVSPPAIAAGPATTSDVATTPRRQAPVPGTWLWSIPMPGLAQVLMGDPAKGFMIFSGAVVTPAIGFLGGQALDHNLLGGQTIYGRAPIRGGGDVVPPPLFTVAGLLLGGSISLTSWGIGIIDAWYMEQRLREQAVVMPQLPAPAP